MGFLNSSHNLSIADAISAGFFEMLVFDVLIFHLSFYRVRPDPGRLAGENEPYQRSVRLTGSLPVVPISISMQLVY